MSTKTDNLKELIFKNRKDLRRWLQKNHTQSESVWLIIHKKNSPGKSITVPEAVEEGLCFGWIDSKANKIDNEKYKLLFAPRKPKSVWSKVNKARIERLITEGLMASPGLAKIEAAKKSGNWSSIDAIEEYEMPAVLKLALAKNKTAHKHFDAFPPSAKKAIYQWIIAAKREETLQKRVLETVSMARQNKRANQYNPKKTQL